MLPEGASVLLATDEPVHLFDAATGHGALRTHAEP